MIVIAIIGILAAIALPAYSSYMKKAKFTEVTSLLDSVKTPIALCIQEFGVSMVQNCVNGKDGFGWEIKAAADYKTKYVASITVGSAQNIADPSSVKKDTEILTVTALSDSATFGKNVNIVVKAYWTAAGQLDWKVDSSSTCIAHDLCKADTVKSGS